MREVEGLRETLRTVEKSSDTDRHSMEVSINDMQQELNKRSQQVREGERERERENNLTFLNCN